MQAFQGTARQGKGTTRGEAGQARKEHAKKEKEHEMALSRRDMRIEELKSELENASGSLEVAITKERYEKERKANKAAINQWETVFKQNEERWKGMQHKMVSQHGI